MTPMSSAIAALMARDYAARSCRLDIDFSWYQPSTSNAPFASALAITALYGACLFVVGLLIIRHFQRNAARSR